jgi:hypothetical protein
MTPVRIPTAALMRIFSNCPENIDHPCTDSDEKKNHGEDRHGMGVLIDKRANIIADRRRNDQADPHAHKPGDIDEFPLFAFFIFFHGGSERKIYHEFHPGDE